MGLKLITSPASEPVTVDEAKAHLAVTGTDLDALITAQIIEARQAIERTIARQLLAATWEYTLDAFPPLIRLPLAPATAVTWIKYREPVAGLEQTLDAGRYVADFVDEPARIVPAYNTTWPEIRPGPAAVTVRFTAGYGATAAAVPAPLKAAVKLLVGHLLANREATTPEQVNDLPLGLNHLLTLYRWC